MKIDFYFQQAGKWSGGGGAFLRNAEHAARIFPILRGESGRSVPIIARNVPATDRFARPYILAPQNAWPYAAPATRNGEALKWGALAASSRFFARRSAGILRISEALPQHSHSTSPVIHNVLEPEFEVALDRAINGASSGTEGGRIVVIGSLMGYRNIPRLLQAYSRYREAGGTVGLDIYGQGRPEAVASLEGQARVLPECRIFASALSRTECLQILRSARLVVLPSLVEASPFSLLEALAVGRAVLASSIAGHRGIVRHLDVHEGLDYFDPRSVESLTGGLMASLTERRSLSGNPLASREFRDHERHRWAKKVAAWAEGMAQSPRLARAVAGSSTF